MKNKQAKKRIELTFRFFYVCCIGLDDYNNRHNAWHSRHCHGFDRSFTQLLIMNVYFGQILWYFVFDRSHLRSGRCIDSGCIKFYGCYKGRVWWYGRFKCGWLECIWHPDLPRSTMAHSNNNDWSWRPCQCDFKRYVPQFNVNSYFVLQFNLNLYFG